MEETTEKLARRDNVYPNEGEHKYGKVEFADERNKKYPIDTAEHVKAALRYWGMPKNKDKYSVGDQAVIERKLMEAAKKFGIDDESKKKKSYDFDFNVISVKAYEHDGKMILEGEASGPEIDQDGERMDKSAINCMRKGIVDGIVKEDGSLSNVPFIDAHRVDGVLAQLGDIVDADILPNNHLMIKAELHEDNPASVSLYKQITERGKKYGLSVAGRVLDAARVYSDDLGRYVKTFKSIDLTEVSVTTRPSWAESYLTAISKSINFDDDKNMENSKSVVQEEVLNTENNALATSEAEVKQENADLNSVTESNETELVTDKSEIQAEPEVTKAGKKISQATNKDLDRIAKMILACHNELRKLTGDDDKMITMQNEDLKNEDDEDDEKEKKSLDIDHSELKSSIENSDLLAKLETMQDEINYLKSLPLQPKGYALNPIKKSETSEEMDMKNQFQKDLENPEMTFSELYKKWLIK